MPVTCTTNAIVADVGAHIMHVTNPLLRAELTSFLSSLWRLARDTSKASGTAAMLMSTPMKADMMLTNA